MTKRIQRQRQSKRSIRRFHAQVDRLIEQRQCIGFIALVKHLRTIWLDRLLRAATTIIRQPILSVTEWHALKPISGAHGEAYYMAWGTDDYPRFCNRPEAPAKPRFDTAPLIAARQRKEEQMLVKVRQPECPGHAPLALVKDPVAYGRTMELYKDRVNAEHDAAFLEKSAGVGVFRALASYVNLTNAQRAWNAHSTASAQQAVTA